MVLSDTTWDVAIIGAGPAGSAAAIELARAGRRVVLIDQEQFPREKVCGGCLSGATVRGIRALLGGEIAMPGVPGTRISFVLGACRLECQSKGTTRVVMRPELDAVLADAAIAAGAVPWFGEKAGLRKSERGWQVLVGEDRIQADVILVAAGVGKFRHELDLRNRATSGGIIGLQWVQPAKASLPPVGGVELHWLHGGYVGLATPEDGCCVVAVAAEAGAYNGESVFERLHRLNPDAQLWTLLTTDALRRHDARGTSGFPWLPDRLGIDNVLLIGDAAGYEEPYTGEGIGLAICSAGCACRAVLAGGGLVEHYEGLMHRYHRPILCRIRHISRLLNTSAVHFLAARPAFVPQGLFSRVIERIHVKGMRRSWDGA